MNILIVDDDEAIGTAIRDLLLLRQHRVRMVMDLEAAEVALAAHAPDVLVADLYIGEQRTDALLFLVRARWPTARRVLVTASTPRAWKELLVTNLAHVVVCKPFDAEELLAAVEG